MLLYHIVTVERRRMSKGWHMEHLLRLYIFIVLVFLTSRIIFLCNYSIKQFWYAKDITFTPLILSIWVFGWWFKAVLVTKFLNYKWTRILQLCLGSDSVQGSCSGRRGEKHICGMVYNQQAVCAILIGSSWQKFHIAISQRHWQKLFMVSNFCR